MEHRKVIIIGSGPAGLTAAIYTGRALLNPLVIEGLQPGGQLTLTPEIENFPGFEKAISGIELMNKMKAQAQRFNVDFLYDAVVDVDFSKRPFKIITEEEEEFTADAVIIATGASAKTLGLKNEKQLIGRGISTCATCDAFFYKDKKVIVVGGGDTAMEDALVLSKTASSVTVIHRRDKLRASKILQKRAFENPKISFIWDSVVVEYLSDDNLSKLTGIKIKNVKTNEITEIGCDGVFLSIGHKPNTDFLKGKLELDEKGYIVVKDGVKTEIDGVFAAGDVHDYKYRQAITAAGYGCQAALEVERYLETLES